MKNKLLKTLLVLSVLVSLVACNNKNKITSYTWNGEDGNVIEISCDTSDKYEFEKKDGVFEVSKNNKILSKVYLVDDEYYNKYKLMANKGKIIKEGKINGYEYTFYKIENEYYHIFWIGVADTGVIVYNKESKSSAKECFERLVFNLKEAPTNPYEDAYEEFYNEQIELIEYYDYFDYTKLDDYFELIDKNKNIVSEKDIKEMKKVNLLDCCFMIDGEKYFLSNGSLSTFAKSIDYKIQTHEHPIDFINNGDNRLLSARNNNNNIQFVINITNNNSDKQMSENDCEITAISQSIYSTKSLSKGRIIFPGGLYVGEKIPNKEELSGKFGHNSRMSWTSIDENIKYYKYEFTEKLGNKNVIYKIHGINGIIVSLTLEIEKNN